MPADAVPALDGLKVIDVATLFAGPLAATMLGDFGADVIKVEHPQRGDAARHHGESKDGVGLWWKMLSRNKRTITLYLGSGEGRDTFLALARDADVVIENFRPGTLERWGLGYDALSAHNPGLVLARVTGFGQFGPMANRAGFGTLAEALTGFAHVTGPADGPPTLPPFGLADGVAAMATAFGIMAALRSRDATGRGQVIDVALIEPLLTLLGPQPTVFDQLGIVQQRNGNRTSSTAPRNAYRTRDGVWLALSTSAQSVAERVMRLVGLPDVVEEPWFASGQQRAEHADELDEAVGRWIGDRDAHVVTAAFEAADAAIAPVLDVAGVMSHPQFRALDSIISVPDPELGHVAMQNVMMRLSATPGRIKWAGPPLGWHNDEVFAGLGMTADQVSHLRAGGVI